MRYDLDGLYGVRTANREVAFDDVTVPFPGFGGNPDTTVIRISSIRGNVTQLGLPSEGNVIQIDAIVSTEPPSTLSVGFPSVTIGFSRLSLISEGVDNTIEGLQCVEFDSSDDGEDDPVLHRGDLRDHLRHRHGAHAAGGCHDVHRHGHHVAPADFAPGEVARDGRIRGCAVEGGRVGAVGQSRDVGEDLDRGRIYLPAEDLARFASWTFRQEGDRYQTRMNAVLRAFMEHARRARPETRVVTAALDTNVAPGPNPETLPLRWTM